MSSLARIIKGLNGVFLTKAVFEDLLAMLFLNDAPQVHP